MRRVPQNSRDLSPSLNTTQNKIATKARIGSSYSCIRGKVLPVFRGSFSIDLAPVPNLDDYDDQLLFSNFIDDAIVAKTNPKQLRTF